MKHILITIAAVVLVGTAFAGPIHNAARDGDLAGVQAELDKGIDVNAKDNILSFTPLDWAVKLKKTETIKLLHKHGGKSAAQDSIHIAAKLGNIEAVKKHLDAGADVNAKRVGSKLTPLDFTKELAASPTMRYMKLPEDTPEIKAAKKEIADLLHKRGGKHSSIYEAAIGGDLEGVKEFLATGVDPDEKTGFAGPKTPLCVASTKEVAELLIAKGADVNAVVRNVGTPLGYAAMKGHKEVAELLIAKGADVNFAKWMTPLDQANRYKHLETADLLRKHGGKTKKELEAEGK